MENETNFPETTAYIE